MAIVLCILHLANGRIVLGLLGVFYRAKCIGLLGVDVITFGGRCNQSFRNSKDVCFPVWMNDRCHATKTA